MTVIFKNIIISYFSFFSINNVSGFRQNVGGELTRVNDGVTRKSRTCSPVRSQCLLFFTGGSNLFKPSIYGEFIELLESIDIHVYDVPFNYGVSQKDIDDLYYNYQYDGVNIIGHSSGCTTILNQCLDLRGINHIFLLDPVNTNFFKEKWNINIKNDDNNNNKRGDGIMSLSFIRAMKSYKITFDPFGLPFIPIFELIAKDLYVFMDNNIDLGIGVNVVKSLDIEDFGHSDILNKNLSDFMHRIRLSVGNKNREGKIRQKYFETILSFILETIQ